MDLVSNAARAVRTLPAGRGKTQLAWLAMRACARSSRLGGAFELHLRDGAHLTLPRSSRMSWEAAFGGGYDAAVQRLLVEYVQPGTLAVDVGASLGLWTVPLGRRARTVQAAVWAVEPHPNNQRWLRGNIAANGLAAFVTVHACALGGENGTTRMQIPEGGRGAAAGNAAIACPGVAAAAVEVPLRRLDDLPRAARVSFVKLDVEGFELEVLRGAQRLLAQDRPVIFGEFNRGWLALRGEDPAACLDGLRDLGYVVLALEGTRSRPWRPVDGHRRRTLAGYAGEEDLLLLPR